MHRALVTAMLTVLAGLLLAPAALAAADESLRGTLRDPDRKPVEGVTITVEQDGRTIGEAETGSNGKWEVAVPGPGRYDVILDASALPDGLRPRTGDKRDDLAVRADQQKNVLFPLTEGSAEASPGQTAPPAATGPSAFGRFLQLLVEGIRLGAIIAITSIGLSLIFGTTRMINFAHGELVTLGAVLAWFVDVDLGLGLIAATAIAVLLGAGFAGGVERWLWQPLRRRGTGLIQLFIVSIGLSLLLRHLIQVWFGANRQSYDDYQRQTQVDFGPIAIVPRDLIVILLSVVVLVAVGLMLQQTRIGKAMRAVRDNRDLAESSGIDVNRVTLTVWAMGGGLATLGGVFYGVTQIVNYDMGFRLLLLMFAGVILGGLGTAYGAMMGGMVVGIVAQVSTLWFPLGIQQVWALLVLIVVLLFRPQGILGRRERIG